MGILHSFAWKYDNMEGFSQRTVTHYELLIILIALLESIIDFAETYWMDIKAYIYLGSERHKIFH